MMRALFLSASVPDPKRDPRYNATADKVAIRDATKALVTVALPCVRLVWGGHPAITPLVRVIAEGIGITGADRVRLYQSRYFEDIAPEDNAVFERVTWTKAVGRNKNKSLEEMRRTMLGSEKFFAGVFIGGMKGVEDEYKMFRDMHPDAIALPVASTGAAALIIYKEYGEKFPPELETDLAYPSLFRKLLYISN